MMIRQPRHFILDLVRTGGCVDTQTILCRRRTTTTARTRERFTRAFGAFRFTSKFRLDHVCRLGAGLGRRRAVRSTPP
jgi:hypothetical protein